MSFLIDLRSLFTNQVVIEEQLENEEYFRSTGTLLPLKFPQVTDLEKVINLIPGRDRLELKIKIDIGDPIVLTKESDPEKFIQGLTNAQAMFPGGIITFELTVDKKCENSTVSVYSLALLRQYLQNRNFAELLEFFYQPLSTDGYRVFHVLDGSRDFNSGAFFFSASGNVIYSGPDQFTRLAVKAKSDRICHYGNSADFLLFPADVSLVARSQHRKWNELFNRLAFMCSIIRLFDITSDTETGLSYRLNGYKTINGEIDLSAAAITTLDEYLQIVDWLYKDGNLSDKIGLARNLISLHITDLPSLALSPFTFASIRSGFDIYLKENIKQYIDIRNKIQDQLLDFNKRATAIIDAFGSGFQKSALAVSTFFGSVLVAKILSGGKYKDVFTYDAYWLNLVFLLVSVGYLVVSYREVDSQMTRFEDGYTLMRKRYRDLLTEDDIDNILAKDAEHNNNMAYLREKRGMYLTLWIVVLILIFIISSLLHIMYVLDTKK